MIRRLTPLQTFLITGLVFIVARSFALGSVVGSVTPAGGRLTISTSLENSRVRLAIADTGVGMSGAP